MQGNAYYYKNGQQHKKNSITGKKYHLEALSDKANGNGCWVGKK
jgi:hypothetical protein